jgi:hypothetical protein
MYSLRINRQIKGRVVSLGGQGTAYIGRNYTILSYDSNWNHKVIGKVPCPLKRRLIEPSRLLCRAFRHEIRAFSFLPNGDRVVATRQGLFYGAGDELLMRPATIAQSDLQIKPPMTITVDSNGRVLWGEYWGNHTRREVRLYISEDMGRSYHPFWRFQRGEVKHVHNIMEDPYDDCYWLFVGDDFTEPGIARISRDLKSVDWLVKGKQLYRAVSGFISADKIIYATDTERDYNHICLLDKTSGKVDLLCDTPGSCIYSSKFGKWYVVTTSVEYFRKYKNDLATLWISQNGYDWHRVFEAKKDIWHKVYFQFGSLVLPRDSWDRDEIIFSGQALKGIEGKVCVAEVVDS